MKMVFSFVKNYKFALFMALFLMLVELVVELVQPIIMGIMIDEGITKSNMDIVLYWATILLILSVVAFVAGIISSFYASKVSQYTGYDLREALYSKIQAFSTSQIQKFTTSSLITRLTNDVTQIQSFLFTSVRIMLRAPLFILGGMIMSFTVNVPLAWILLSVVPVLLVIMFILLTKGVRLFGDVQAKLDRLNTVIRENLFGIRLVKSFNRGPFESERFSKENESLRLSNRQALRLMEYTMPVVMLGLNVTMVAILWGGSIQLRFGDAQTGDIVAIINYATRILGAFGVFTFLLLTFSRGKASAERLEKVLSEAPKDSITTGKKRPSLQGGIAFQKVFFHYEEKDVSVLKEVSFEVRPSETIGILGETGSGKSSLLQLIPNLIQPSSGHIFLDRLPMSELDPAYIRKQIGIVPQEAHLFSGTIKDNLLWGKNDATDEQLVEAAKDASIHEFIMSLPDQYDTLIGQRGVNLSGGQKQRLSLARALVREPKILLLDDSTSALDAQTEKQVLSALAKRKCTVINVAQKVSSVKDSDQILLLKDGIVQERGTHQELLRSSSYYQQIYQSQVGKGVYASGE
ncbi:ABC transporter ATP-binding protein/permease [Radiobacillus kanasensis]|uniref:ABC transporter ATP-binding protein n=1 Tax=Radiobacillus kanasensis TaxID=2844358 RepID=UPI001E6223AA|nr:ABC transporter ATP-binding protein [Radiobacillus kanasensis]UFT99110.1 ABC transporter ATP-binding protein/permease [Radiobacillus kanasensis]